MSNNKILEKLFDISYKIQKIEPWNLIDDSKAFAVRLPDTDEISYVSISGINNEFCEINIFHGMKKLKNYMIEISFFLMTMTFLIMKNI